MLIFTFFFLSFTGTARLIQAYTRKVPYALIPYIY